MSDLQETDDARSQRQLTELLNEVRVAMPGVQVLFAFLLAVPFQARFAEVTNAERWLFFVALMTSAVASASFVASAAVHRLLFHQHQRAYVIKMGNRFVIGGLAALAVAMTSAIAFVTAFLYSAPAAAIAGGLALALFGTLWFAIPLTRRLRQEEHRAG